MSKPFHLAIPAGDLDVATSFYQNILGCKLGNKEEGKWIDVDFWGNELTLHKTHTKLPKERHAVDMGSVSIPHFGAHLDKEVFEKIKAGGGEYSLFALTDKGYEKLSLNFADIRNKLAEQRQIILSYKDYYESE